MRVRRGMRRNYLTFRRWYRRVRFRPCAEIEVVPGDDSALVAFAKIESLGMPAGRVVSCSEPEKLKEAVYGKAGLTWQIRQWASGMACGLFPRPETEEYCRPYPEWVWEAVQRERWRIACETGCWRTGECVVV